MKRIVKIEGQASINGGVIACLSCSETQGLVLSIDTDTSDPVEVDCPNGHSGTNSRIPRAFVDFAFANSERIV